MKKVTERLTLKNDFHKTEAVVVAKDGIVSSDSLKRAEKKLCGMDGCRCGGVRGCQDRVVRREVRNDKEVLIVLE